MNKQGSPYGTHRVLEPLGVLPQGAWKIDNRIHPIGGDQTLQIRSRPVIRAGYYQALPSGSRSRS